MNRFYCFNCGKRLKYADEHTDKKLKCPNCGHPLSLPDEPPPGPPHTEIHAERPPAPNEAAVGPFNRKVVASLTAGVVLLVAAVSLTIWLISQRGESNPDEVETAKRNPDNGGQTDETTPPKSDPPKSDPPKTDPPKSDPPKSDPPEVKKNIDLASKTKTILQTNCYRCHGNGGSKEGGFGYVLDQPQLLASKKVVPGDLNGSKLYQKLVKKQMPPSEDDDGNPITQRPSADDIDIIKQWIEAGAPDFNTTVVKTDFIRPAKMFELMRDDLKSIDDHERRFIRYFTLTHLANAGVAAGDMQTYRNGLSKLVNSLSWGRKIVPPKPIDPGQTILRINITDYDWDENTWNAIVAQNPFAVAYTTAAAKECYDLTLTNQPCVRADWFINTAARPPLYHTILKMPNTDRELEASLRIDVSEDIRKELVQRAGFNGSGVSQNNRLIERHRTAFGAYWRSYDFGSSVDRKNLFQHPLGPGAGDNFFQQDGGEIIFNLPNKLQAYMLVNAVGQRLDKGPLNIVSDPKQKDRAVVNGISCMSCHVQGMIEKTDQVRDAVLKAPDGYTEDELGTIKHLYPIKDEFDKLLKEDGDRFKKAVAATGTDPTASDPVEASSLRFEGELNLKLAAAETGVTPEEFLKELEKAPPELLRVFSPLRLDAGTVQRDVMLKEFRELERVMEQEQFVPGVGIEEGTVTTASGLKYRDIIVGTGEEAKTNRRVVINYTATLTDGKKVDSSFDHNKPFEFLLGSDAVIKGWNEGIVGMKVGGKRKLAVPFQLAYGDKGVAPLIPEKADLIYEIELVTVR
jgi:FKBP-type peptidyl-prolyl cis-trans isomerase